MASATIARDISTYQEREGSHSALHIHTLGCKVNQAESETIAAALLSAGWTRAETADTSDVNILNTCTVTGEADTKNRKAIRSLLRAGDMPLIVTGCAINIDDNAYGGI